MLVVVGRWASRGHGRAHHHSPGVRRRRPSRGGWPSTPPKPPKPADPSRDPQRNGHVGPRRIWTGSSISPERERLWPLWVLLASTGLRRGRPLGLKWSDLNGGTLAVSLTLGVVAHKPVWGEPKTAAGRRTVALDDATIKVLRAHRAGQLEERLAIGPGYRDQDLMFCDPTGEPLHPESVSMVFGRRVARHRLPASACTACVTRGPRWRSARRAPPSGSAAAGALDLFRSRWARTRMCRRGWTRTPPRKSPGFSWGVRNDRPED